jgi:hypothetical protein
MAEPTRRTALRRGLLFMGGLVGIGAASKLGAASGVGEVSAAGGTSLVLRAQNLQVHVGGQRTARLPASGEPGAAHGDLVDPGGRRVGEVHVALMPVHGPGRASADAGTMEWHTFHLDGGTIIGSGSAGTEGGSFAVIGGTGAYAGARGTYTLRRTGMDSAEFVLQLVP